MISHVATKSRTVTKVRNAVSIATKKKSDHQCYPQAVGITGPVRIFVFVFNSLYHFPYPIYSRQILYREQSDYITV